MNFERIQNRNKFAEIGRLRKEVETSSGAFDTFVKNLNLKEKITINLLKLEYKYFMMQVCLVDLTTKIKSLRIILFLIIYEEEN